MKIPKQSTRKISITPELQAALEQFPNENWSAIAREAFKTRLAQLNIMNIPDQTQAAIARFKASKKSAIDELYRDGELAGAWFTLHRADHLRIERLTDWRDQLGSNYQAVFCSSPPLSLRKVFFVTENEDRDNPDSSDGLLEEFQERYGSNIDKSRWLEGFVDGALSKYNELMEQAEEQEAGTATTGVTAEHRMSARAARGKPVR